MPLSTPLRSSSTDLVPCMLFERNVDGVRSARERVMSLILTRAELCELTGLSQAKRITRWLESRGWVFEPPARRGDIPKVDRSYYLARMSARPANSDRLTGPRLSFMTGGTR